MCAIWCAHYCSFSLIFSKMCSWMFLLVNPIVHLLSLNLLSWLILFFKQIMRCAIWLLIIGSLLWYSERCVLFFFQIVRCAICCAHYCFSPLISWYVYLWFIFSLICYLFCSLMLLSVDNFKRCAHNCFYLFNQIVMCSIWCDILKCVFMIVFFYLIKLWGVLFVVLIILSLQWYFERCIHDLSFLFKLLYVLFGVHIIFSLLWYFEGCANYWFFFKNKLWGVLIGHLLSFLLFTILKGVFMICSCLIQL